MCGIVGFTGAKNSKILNTMMDSIFHRGPDDGALLENDFFSVGFRRLSIIDLSKNIYPIYNEDKTLAVFLNGEIYNYQVLKVELEALGHHFKTASDTEVIVHGYEEWGKNVVSHLRGMFVFVLFDSQKNLLFIARDRLGIKPFYYAEIEGRIVFGSEIKSLFAGFDIQRDPDDISIYRFLNSRVHDTDKNTFFNNVKRLLPGHLMTIEHDGNFRTKKYWEPTFNPQFKGIKPDKEYANEFREIFTEAVKLHMIADVPVGVTLSGGLDSSGITALASKLFFESKGADNAKKFYTFSAVHPGESVNEEAYIDNVVKETGVTSVKVVPDVETFWNDLLTWTYFQEEPVISGAPYAYYVVMREARKYVTVILTGQGGDELMAGYIPYFMSYLSSAIKQGQYYSALREVFMGNDLYLKYIFKKLESILQKGKQISPLNYLKGYKEDFEIKFTHKSNLNERLFEDVTSATTPCLLRYEDKNSMANSLESRVPFFDHIVTEYLFNLPIDQKIKFGWNRYIYREALKNLMPEKNRTRRSKIGFTNPEWEWIVRKSDKFLEIFKSDSFKSRKYWDADKIVWGFTKAIKGEIKGDILFFWRVFSVEMWLRTYVDNFTPLNTKELVYYRKV